MRFRGSAFLAILAFLAFPVVAAAQDTVRELEITENADYAGFDLRAEKEITLDQCKQQCLDDTQCRAFTYNTRVSWCFLKSDFGDAASFEGAIAGKVVERTAEADIGAPPPLTFVPARYADEARNLERDVRNARLPVDAGNAEELARQAVQALNNNQTGEAEKLFGFSLNVDQDNIDSWIAVSRFLSNWLSGRNGYDYNIQQLASASAIHAYGISRTASKRALALAAVAEALIERKLYRPAMTAYSQSLELANSPEIAEAYQKLRDEKGFRVTGHEVEADSANPRICVDFSEELVKSGVDYEQFVSMRGANATAISASGSRLCAEGLDHGAEYSLTLREGLPAAIGETLRKPAVFNGYVRDRAPAVRMDGDNFVLASSARRGIPLTGINAGSADLKLYRVGDRALNRLISQSDFLSQLNSYSLSQLEYDLGSLVWEGTVDLETERNREVVTSFPVNEALPQRQPGIYVLTATVDGEDRNEWDPRATQWFLVSDIGLVTWSGNDGLTVIANSLDSAQPKPGVELTLLARNNEVLGSATTDDSGKAVFDPGLMRGTSGLTPTLLTARATGIETDFIFLDLTRAGFDLSDRGVEGRAAPGPLDIYTYLDRGIYRPGETVNAVSLARDNNADAVAGLPLTAIYYRPDGVEAKRITSTAPSLGGHETAFELLATAMRGAWRLALYSDPQSSPISEKLFLVEDFQPDRIEFDLEAGDDRIAVQQPAAVTVDGRYLYGAPAADLNVDAKLRLKPVRTRSEAPGYFFGLADEDDNGDTEIDLGGPYVTDENGQVEVTALVDSLPATTRPLSAEITVQMRESGGRAVEEQLTLPVAAEGPMIGVKSEFADGQVAEGSTARFSVVALDASGARIAMSGLRYALYEIKRNYQWYRDGSYWRYEAVEIPVLVTNGTVDVSASDTASIAEPVQWGRYRLDVESDEAAGPATSVLFDAGWYVDTASTETPDALEIALDKPVYQPGDTAKLNVSPHHAGELIVAVGAQNIRELHRVEIPAGSGEVDIPVGDNWGGGAYVTAILLRPGQVEERRLPARAIGVTWLKVDPGAKALSVSLDLPEKIRPNSQLSIPVSVGGLGAGEEAFVTVAAVDVGILNLTDYDPPNPGDWYFGQRALGLEIRDIYGRLIDSSQGGFGRIRSGGDGPGLTAQGSPPTEKLLSLYSGIVRLDAEGKAVIDFEVPQFIGTARVMAVAWSKSGVGQANGDVIIRDPVVVSASLPKVLAPEDVANTIVEIHNTDGDAGTYELSAASDDLVSFDGLPDTIELREGERKVLNLSITAQKPGIGEMVFTVTREGEIAAQVVRVVNVRPATAPVSTKTEFVLAADTGSVTVDSAILGDSYIDGAQVSLSVTRDRAINLSALLARLNRYPYGCAEQTTSKAMPLLYLSDLGAPAELTQADDLTERIEGAIERVLTFQSAGGAFGLWGPGEGDLWLDAYVSDFLTRAREKGFDVPEQGMRLAVQNLQNTLAYQDDIASNGNAIAYALYVLARNRMASATDLRYYADTKLGEFDTPLSRAHLAAALSLYNEQQRTSRAFSSALELANATVDENFSRADYGTPLRDGAAMLALAAESREATPLVPQMLDFVEQAIAGRSYTSTQEDAWLVLAGRAIAERNAEIELDVDGATHSGALNRQISGEELVGGSIRVANRYAQDLTATVTKLASPIQPLPAGGEGYEIQRQYYDLQGNEATLNAVSQNDRFVVVLTVAEFEDRLSQVLVTDLLPGGFEIDNPSLVKSAELENFGWLPEADVAHTEFRDDRFVAALTRNSGSERTFQLAYVVRAVTPGTYTHPAASVEDMYRPENQARTATGFLEIGPSQ